MIICKYVNPNHKTRSPWNAFLNSGFFDCTVSDYRYNQTYYVATINGKTVGVRKVLTEFNTYFHKTKWSDRLGDFLEKERDVYYLQAIAVDPAFRGQGVGSSLLDASMRDIPKSAQVFSSLCEGNTIKNSYFDKYGFKLLLVTENRYVIGVNPMGDQCKSLNLERNY